MALEGELVTDPGALAAMAPSWDALAVANRSPMSLPEWTFAWLRHLAPVDTRLRAVVVREQGEVIGVAPMFVQEGGHGRIDCRFTGAPLPRLGPLALRDREWEVSEVVGRVLSQTHPHIDAIAFESHSMASPWPRVLAQTWPSRLTPPTVQYLVHASPVVSMREASFEEWLAGKSANFRSEMRRRRRRFADAGGGVRVSTAETIHDDISTFMRLHSGRWEGRGESSIVTRREAYQAWFDDVGNAYAGDGRFRVVLLELDGAPIAAQIHSAAGGEVLFMNGGWDEAHARLSPSVLCLLAALEDAYARGDQRLDLGSGAQHYKLRMADGNDPVAWTLLMTPGARMPLTFAHAAPMVAKRRTLSFVKRAVTEEQLSRLRTLRQRWR